MGEGLAGEERGELRSRCNIWENNKEKRKEGKKGKQGPCFCPMLTGDVIWQEQCSALRSLSTVLTEATARGEHC